MRFQDLLHHRALVAAAFAVLLSAGSTPALAQCTGDCGSEILDVPKQLEKYVKAASKALTTCAKKNEPVCPTACPLPDATADPYLLGASCGALVVCELRAQTEAAVTAAAWDGDVGCSIAAADDCGNARASAAAKLVSNKLKRRRTSKMDKFPGDRDKCVAKANKPGACDGETLCASAGDWLDSVVPIQLTKGGYQTLPFTASASGEGKAVLSLSAIGADWGSRESESVVVEYDVDGVTAGTIVVYDGANATDYPVMLGALSAGPHAIGLRHSKTLSPAPTAPVLVNAPALVTVLESTDPGYDALRFAPVLNGIDTELNSFQAHPGNAVSDVPVVEYVRAIAGVGETTYRYVMIWSNEDGGTGVYPEVLMARYGRTTDIEGIVEVDVSDLGVLQEVRFRPDESGSLTVFGGSFFSGTHPIVRTSTSNGLIEDDGDSTLRFLLAPFEFDDTGLPREQGMDLYPTAYRTMGKEMVREIKTERPTANPNNKKLSDARNYLFVDYNIDVDASGDVLRAYAVVDGVHYGSDHYQFGGGPLGMNIGDGIARTAVELPPGTTPADITEFGMQGVGTVSGTMYALRTFMLDTDYQPLPSTSFSGSMFVAGPNPTWALTP